MTKVTKQLLKKVRNTFVKRVTVVTLMMIAPAAWSASQGTADMVPHRVIYSLANQQVRPDSPFVAAEGDFTMEIAESCEGWTLSQRIRLVFNDKMGGRIETDYRFASFESRDGLSYDFSVKNTHDDMVIEDFSGNAKLTALGKGGIVHFRRPENKEMKLPEGTLFPIQYNLALVRSITAGDKIMPGITFDGGSDTAPYQVNAVIGLPTENNIGQGKGDPNLLKGKVWPVRIAYFNMDETKAEPNFELDVHMLKNGISPSMVLDYGYIRVGGTLEKIEALPRPNCGTQQR
ncbi:MAG: DUF1849 family protein [Alphaproteobacteria bacterium]